MEKHGACLYRLWARMKHTDQHSSLDTPPSIPLTSKPPKQDSLSDALTSTATAVVR